ncbi:MAG: lysylphosphatidylglycerol synthase transmembrane domain-containing protein [Chloroflexi bacterium]|nr:lysylphosphatidylglycerol synthase transmembrane domain-containing protein [Chloroflexota bacterium]
MKKGSKRLATTSGIIISVVFLYLAFRDLKAEQFWSSIHTVKVQLLLLAVPTYFIALTVIALRWQYLLRAVRLIPLRSLAELVTICYMGNGVYPLRAGEALRIYLLRRNHNVPLASATATVMVERAFDGVVMLSFIMFSLLFIDIQSAEVGTIVSIATPLFVGAVMVFFLLAAKPALMRKLISGASRFLPSRLETLVNHLGEDMIVGLAGLRTPTLLLGAVISSYVTWAIEAAVYWIVMFAFGLDLGFTVALLIIGAVNLAGVVSAAPGQVGVYEFVVSTILIALGTSAPIAAGYAVVVHLVIWIPTTLFGFLLLLRQGMDFADIRRARELEQALS